MYRAARNLNRCAVSFDRLKLPVSMKRAVEILQAPPLNFELEWDLFGRKIIHFARHLPKPPTYRRGARLAEAPDTVDCSSFIWWLYSLMGIELERYSIDQRKQGSPVKVGNVHPGDLVFTTGSRHNHWNEDNPEMTIGHVALATDGGHVIHATRRGVVEEDVKTLLSRREFRDIRRVVPGDDDFFTFTTNPYWEVRGTLDIYRLILQNL
ncbi:MAG: NlpC/P60 family protein [Patescibacteria group bacterium]|nr:NlpC/P60 family protein [Patescibacteria group bacterium]